MSSDLFDFGFTAVTEDELEVVSTLQEKADKTLDYQTRLENVYNAVQPLLNNLKANPEKDYIYWPNRLDKVEEFSDLLDQLYKGES